MAGIVKGDIASNVHRYVIIGGTTKAATTSLFNYLADHPDICASNIKETRFFLDSAYSLPAKYRLEEGLEKYELFFKHCHGKQCRMEATPDYLYSPGTPQKIKKSLSNVKLIFILREPIDRLVSWYRYAKQTARIPARMSFEEYVHLQLEDGNRSEPVAQHMHALEQGCYSTYVMAYSRAFEREQLHIVQYEALKHEPATVINTICRFAGIDPNFYQNYDFQVFNPTQTMRSASLHRVYKQFRNNIIMRLHDKQRLRAILRSLRMRVEPLYLRLNTRLDEQVVIPTSLRALLEDYYSGEPDALARLLGSEQVFWHVPEGYDGSSEKR